MDRAYESVVAYAEVSFPAAVAHADRREIASADGADEAFADDHGDLEVAANHGPLLRPDETMKHSYSKNKLGSRVKCLIFSVFTH